MPVTLQYGIRDVEILARETVFQGHFAVAKLTLRHRRFGGDWSREMTREVFERGDAVGVLPYDPVTDSVILIETIIVSSFNRLLPNRIKTDQL